MAVAESLPDPGCGEDRLLPGVFQPGWYLGPDTGCPREFADVPVGELFAQIDEARHERAMAAAGESLAAGFRRRTPLIPAQSGSGFESGGALDTCAPDATLAGLADAVTRDGCLAELDDDELVGVMRAWQRIESWASASLLATVAELGRRRPAPGTAPPAPKAFPDQISEFTSDEVAAALTLTSQAASTCTDLALDLAIRLPGTARAHREGRIDRAQVRLIAEATRILSDEDARQVEALILPKAAGQTTGQLRAAVARAVIAVDPEAAARRREEAQKDPRVRRWQEDAGTAALAGYGLPPADVLAADQRLSGRALALRDAGVPGSIEELRARAYLDALLDRDSTPAPAPGPRLPALINLTVPLATHLGLADQPGLATGFGPLDGPLARHLTTLAATDPRTRCCLTLTGPDGSAIGHGCLPGPGALATLGTQPVTVTITPLARGSCDHSHQEPGYQPSRKLRHLIAARTPTCTAPGCRQPAARCDLDHTTPYDQGGRTCQCGLAPLCRHHHRCKQSEGWQLQQPAPGVMQWTTPAGRRYVSTPDAYP
jgi:hypothetical protein